MPQSKTVILFPNKRGYRSYLPQKCLHPPSSRRSIQHARRVRVRVKVRIRSGIHMLVVTTRIDQLSYLNMAHRTNPSLISSSKVFKRPGPLSPLGVITAVRDPPCSTHTCINKQLRQHTSHVHLFSQDPAAKWLERGADSQQQPLQLDAAAQQPRGYVRCVRTPRSRTGLPGAGEALSFDVSVPHVRIGGVVRHGCDAMQCRMQVRLSPLICRTTHPWGP